MSAPDRQGLSCSAASLECAKGVAIPCARRLAAEHDRLPQSGHILVQRIPNLLSSVDSFHGISEIKDELSDFLISGGGDRVSISRSAFLANYSTRLQISPGQAF